MKKFRIVASFVALVAMTALVALPAEADPPGNNGTIKIDGQPFDSAPDNQPHVDCLFQVDFYGFDQGNYFGTATFELQPPTAGGTPLTQSIFIGGDPAGGGTDLDGSMTVNVSPLIFGSGVQPQQNQGWHVYLTVLAEGSIGSMVKHKSFWVLDCGS